MVHLNDAKKLLKDYEEDLEFEEAFGFILVRFKAFVSKDLFDKVYALVRDADGEYVSAGKKSHFRLKGEKPEQAQEKPGKMTQTKLVQQAKEQIDLAVAKQKEVSEHLKLAATNLREAYHDA